MTTSKTRAEESKIGDIGAVVFDADDTLVDYRKDATRAFRAALKAVGRDEEDVLEACLAFDYGNWDKAGLSDVHLPEIQKKYHELYRGHVRAIFDHVEETLGLFGKAREAETVFMEAFFAAGHPIEGAMEAVTLLHRHCPVYAATNGLAGQRQRLSAFPLDGIFISEELGSIKPQPAFFAEVAGKIGLPPQNILMVGDSLSSDIAGARLAGYACIFFNPMCKKNESGAEEIASLPELYPRILPRLKKAPEVRQAF